MSQNELVLDGYSNLELLEKYYSSELYKGIEETTGDRVSIKVLSELPNSQVQDRFDQELEILKQVQDVEGVAKLLDSGVSDNGSYYLVSKFYPKGSLQDLLVFEGPMEWEYSVEIISELCEVLLRVYEKNVFHTDIQPANILLTDELEPIILNFGQRSANQSLEDESDILIHTPAYSSPDILLDAKSSSGLKSDIYGVGATLWALIVGKPPISVPVGGAKEAAKVIKNTALEDISITGLVPKELFSILQKALAKDPNDRHKSLDEFLADLKSIKSSELEDPQLFVEGASGNSGSLKAQEETVVGARPLSMPTFAPPILSEDTEIRVDNEEFNKSDNHGRTLVDELNPVENYYEADDSEAEYYDEDEMVEVVTSPAKDDKGFPFFLVISVIVITVAACAGVFWLYSNSLLGRTEVANYVGMSIEDVKTDLADTAIVINIEDGRQDGSEEGEVLEQRPVAGTNIDSDGAIILVVSQGGELKELPELVGLSIEDASSQLEDLGLIPGEEVSEQDSADIAEGMIVELQVDGRKADPEYATGTVINFVTSNGLVTIPRVGAQEIRSVLGSELKLAVEIVEEFSDQIEPGEVVRSSPPVGTKVAPGSSILVYVATDVPPSDVSVPSVNGRDVENAVRALRGRGFNVAFESGSPGDCNLFSGGRKRNQCNWYSKDQVWRHTPEGEAPEGATITIVASEEAINEAKEDDDN